MKKRIIFFSILGIIFYFFIFPMPLTHERYFSAGQVIKLTEAGTPVPSENERIPFKTPTYFGYLNKNFELELLLATEKRAGASKDYFVLYDESDAPVEVKTSANLTIATIDDVGVPFIFDKNLYFINNATGAINTYSAAGQLLWSYDTGSPITAFTVKADIALVGLLSENIIFLDGNGKLLSQYRPGGSRYGAIYGVTLADDAQHAAIISGLEPQRFILFKRGVVDYTPLYHNELGSSQNVPLLLAFSKNQRYISYEERNLFHTYNIVTKEASTLPYKGELKVINNNTFDNFQSILSQDGTDWELQIFSFNGKRTILSNQFTAQNASLIGLDKNKFALLANQSLFLILYQEAYHSAEK